MHPSSPMPAGSGSQLLEATVSCSRCGADLPSQRLSWSHCSVCNTLRELALSDQSLLQTSSAWHKGVTSGAKLLALAAAAKAGCLTLAAIYCVTADPQRMTGFASFVIFVAIAFTVAAVVMDWQGCMRLGRPHPAILPAFVSSTPAALLRVASIIAFVASCVPLLLPCLLFSRLLALPPIPFVPRAGIPATLGGVPGGASLTLLLLAPLAVLLTSLVKCVLIALTARDIARRLPQAPFIQASETVIPSLSLKATLAWMAAIELALWLATLAIFFSPVADKAVDVPALGAVLLMPLLIAKIVRGLTLFSLYRRLQELLARRRG